MSPSEQVEEKFIAGPDDYQYEPPPTLEPKK